MDRATGILNAYASADEIGRLHLFLTHRELRGRFIRIETEEPAIAAKKRRERYTCRWLDRLWAHFETI